MLNLQNLLLFLYEQDNPKYARFQAAANIFIYFYFNTLIHTKLGSFKLGVGLSNCSYKTRHYIYVRKANFAFSISQMSMLAQQDQKHFEKCTD